MWLNSKADRPPAGLDFTLTALADPTRRAILARLSAGETRVTDVAEPFDISLNAVSKHIRTLERAKLITRRKVGSEHLLSLNTAPADAAAEWLQSERTRWSVRLQKLDAMLNTEAPSIRTDNDK